MQQITMKKRNPETENIRSRAWLVVAAGFLMVFILYGSYYCFGVFLKPMLAELGWTRAMISGAFSLYMLVHGGFSMVMGSLSDRYGARLIAAISALVVAVGYGFVSITTTPWHMYVGFGILVGIGMGAAYVTPISTVTRWFSEKRGLALGIVAAGVGVGQMVLPPIIKYLITLSGWRVSFVILGVMVFLIGIPAALLLNSPTGRGSGIPRVESEKPEAEAHQRRSPHYDWTVREVLGTPGFWLLLLIFSALAFGVTIMAAHLVAHMEDIGIDSVPAAFALTLIGGGGIIGRIFFGRAGDRVGNRPMLTASMILQTLLMFFLIKSKQVWAFYLISGLYGLSYGGALPVIISMSSQFYGVASAGAILGILLFGATIGGAIGATLAGYIFDVTGGYALAFLAGGSVITSGTVISFLLRPPEKEHWR
jgi:MFS family permease